MDLYDLAEEHHRILTSTVNVANAQIATLNAACQEGQITSKHLSATLRRKISETRQAWRIVAERDLEVTRMGDTISSLKKDLAFERYHNNRLRNERYQHVPALRRREEKWTTWLGRAKATVSILLWELAQAVSALYRTDSPRGIAENVERDALRTLEEAPEPWALVEHDASDVPGAVPWLDSVVT